jgi:hypothetical protein
LVNLLSPNLVSSFIRPLQYLPLSNSLPQGESIKNPSKEGFFMLTLFYIFIIKI